MTHASAAMPQPTATKAIASTAPLENATRPDSTPCRRDNDGRNSFDSAGPESTVRLVSVLRTATIENRIANSNKHNYRIHGTSDLAYARDNLLINTGVMLGRMAGDTLNRIWFDDNVFHHVAPDLFNPDGAIGSLRARRNLAMTDVWSCFYCGSTPAGWDIADNVVAPYTPAP